MGPDLTSLPGDSPGANPRTAGCPSCGAALRPGSPWCSLCYADLRPQAAAPVAPPAAPALPPTAPLAAPAAAPYGVPAGDPLTQPLLDFLPPVPTAAPAAPAVAAPGTEQPAAAEATGRGWPCSRCGEVNPITLEACAGCGAGFLSGLAAQGKIELTLPLVGDVTAMSQGQRYAVAAGVALVVLLPFALVMMLLTHGSSAPAPAPDGSAQTVTTSP